MLPPVADLVNAAIRVAEKDSPVDSLKSASIENFSRGELEARVEGGISHGSRQVRRSALLMLEWALFAQF